MFYGNSLSVLFHFRWISETHTCIGRVLHKYQFSSWSFTLQLYHANYCTDCSHNCCYWHVGHALLASCHNDFMLTEANSIVNSVLLSSSTTVAVLFTSWTMTDERGNCSHWSTCIAAPTVWQYSHLLSTGITDKSMWLSTGYQAVTEVSHACVSRNSVNAFRNLSTCLEIRTYQLYHLNKVPKVPVILASITLVVNDPGTSNSTGTLSMNTLAAASALYVLSSYHLL